MKETYSQLTANRMFSSLYGPGKDRTENGYSSLVASLFVALRLTVCLVT
jgi:hypothetical protein